MSRTVGVHLNPQVHMRFENDPLCPERAAPFFFVGGSEVLLHTTIRILLDMRGYCGKLFGIRVTAVM